MLRLEQIVHFLLIAYIVLPAFRFSFVFKVPHLDNMSNPQVEAFQELVDILANQQRQVYVTVGGPSARPVSAQYCMIQSLVSV
jgi:hypothetical protein